MVGRQKWRTNQHWEMGLADACSPISFDNLPKLCLSHKNWQFHLNDFLFIVID